MCLVLRRQRKGTRFKWVPWRCTGNKSSQIGDWSSQQCGKHGSTHLVEGQERDQVGGREMQIRVRSWKPSTCGVSEEWEQGYNGSTLEKQAGSDSVKYGLQLWAFWKLTKDPSPLFLFLPCLLLFNYSNTVHVQRNLKPWIKCGEDWRVDVSPYLSKGTWNILIIKFSIF